MPLAPKRLTSLFRDKKRNSLRFRFFIEIIFNLDGIGLLGFEAISQRDYPVIFGTLFLFTLLGLVLRLMSDVLYQVIDPRINFDARGM